jgi:hypothetical protein
MDVKLLLYACIKQGTAGLKKVPTKFIGRYWEGLVPHEEIANV